MNYTPEITKVIVAQYLKEPTRDTVDLLAHTYNKSYKSIIGKLSKEGVYRRKVYKSKTGEDPITKIELVAEIAEVLHLDSEELEGLDKTPKLVLKKLKKSIQRMILLIIS